MRRGLTLIELVMVALVMAVFTAVAWNVFSGSVRGLATAGDHQVAVRNALLLTTALDRDFRAAAVLNGAAVSPSSVALSPARTGLRLRVSAPIESLPADPASRFMVVTYQLQQHKGLFVVRREERTATETRSHTFEDLTVTSLRLRLVAWLAPRGCRQYVTMYLAASESGRIYPITRQFEVAAPPAASAFALEFPASSMASQLAGGFDLVGRPGNTDPLEAPPDALTRAGQAIELPPETPRGPVQDPFARVHPKAGPLRSQFLQAALDRLESAVGAGYRGALCGQLADDVRFRLDASEACPSPVIVQLDELIDRIKSPPLMVELLARMQLERFPGTDKPPLEAAAELLSEPKGFAN